MGMCDDPGSIRSSRKYRVNKASFEIRFRENQRAQLKQLAQKFGAEFDESEQLECLTKERKPKSPQEFSLAFHVHERRNWRGFRQAVEAAGIKIKRYGHPIGAVVDSMAGEYM
jgi:hypothetical protein